MSGATVVTNQEYCRNCIRIDQHSTQNQSRTTEIKGLENNVDRNVACSCNNYSSGQCAGSQEKLVNEDDLRDMLTMLRRRQKPLGDGSHGLNLTGWAEFYSFPRLLLTNNTVENHLDPFVLQPSLFHRNQVPPTVFFNTKLSDQSRPPIGLPKILQSYFKWKISSITPNSIRNCIAFMKFDAIKQSNTCDTVYLGSWCKHMLTSEFTHLEEWKKVNHYPGSFHLGRKDKLWLRLKMASKKYGSESFGNFHPKTFVLPKDYDELCDYWKSSSSKLFIMKPPASARGNGIKVINDISQIPESALTVPPQANGSQSKKTTMIVQQYISNPCLLENGHKFDLRVYVLLTSIDPLRIYVYDEGLVRFASSKYTMQEDGIIDQYMHLTNYFINKQNQEYQINNDCDSLHGSKWSLKRFWRYLREYHTQIDAQKLWERIVDIIIKTIICCEGPMTRLTHLNCKNDYTSYELFGFDIILDENFKPWILEVNITPSLKSESDLDTTVKYGVIKDMFNLVGYNLPPINPDDVARLGDMADCKLFHNSKMYTANLTKRDKMKQLRYQKLFKTQYESNRSASQQSDATICPPDSSQNLEPTSQSDPDMRATSHVMNESLKRFRSNSNETCSEDDSGCYTTDSTNDGILDDLTQDDLRVLMLSEDELSRCGQFKRVFPSSNTGEYLKYFDKPRYYNLLLDAWERKYKDNRLQGIIRLSDLAGTMNLAENS